MTTTPINARHLKQVRGQLQQSCLDKGWSRSQFSTWWSKHKSLHHREIKKRFKLSPLSETNPDIYHHYQALSKVFLPYQEEITRLMSKYCDRRINTGSDRINEGQLLFQLKNDLLEIIDNKMAVEAYVEAVKIYSRDRAKEASYSFEV